MKILTEEQLEEIRENFSPKNLKNLADCRQAINSLDELILDCIKIRDTVVGSVKGIKDKELKEINSTAKLSLHTRPDREHKMIAQRQKSSNLELSFIKNLFRMIISRSCSLEQKLIFGLVAGKEKIHKYYISVFMHFFPEEGKLKIFDSEIDLFNAIKNNEVQIGISSTMGYEFCKLIAQSYKDGIVAQADSSPSKNAILVATTLETVKITQDDIRETLFVIGKFPLAPEDKSDMYDLFISDTRNNLDDNTKILKDISPNTLSSDASNARYAIKDKSQLDDSSTLNARCIVMARPQNSASPSLSKIGYCFR